MTEDRNRYRGQLDAFAASMPPFPTVRDDGPYNDAVDGWKDSMDAVAAYLADKPIMEADRKRVDAIRAMRPTLERLETVRSYALPFWLREIEAIASALDPKPLTSRERARVKRARKFPTTPTSVFLARNAIAAIAEKYGIPPVSRAGGMPPQPPGTDTAEPSMKPRR